jgi:hypothetical protein
MTDIAVGEILRVMKVFLAMHATKARRLIPHPSERKDPPGISRLASRTAAR